MELTNRISSEVMPGLTRCDLRVANLDLNRISILSEVSKEFDVYISLITSPLIERSISIPRQVAQLFTMLIPGYTLEQTGREIGDRNHSTVSYSLRTVVQIYTVDRKFRERVNYIRDRLGISESTFDIHLDRWRKSNKIMEA